MYVDGIIIVKMLSIQLYGGENDKHKDRAYI